MTISHWGVFPGWWVPTTNRIGCGTYRFEACDFETFCMALDIAAENEIRFAAADAAALRSIGVKFH